MERVSIRASKLEKAGIKLSTKSRITHLASLFKIPEDIATKLDKLTRTKTINGQAGRTMSEINRMIGGQGIESLQGKASTNPYWSGTVALLVEFSDAHKQTVIYDCVQGKFLVTDRHSFIEDNVKRYQFIQL